MSTPTELFDLGNLATLAGLSAALYVLLTALRPLLPTMHIKTAAVGIGVLLSLLVGYLTQPVSGEMFLLAIVNGVLAAVTATGGSKWVEELLITLAPERMFNAQDDGHDWWRAW